MIPLLRVFSYILASVPFVPFLFICDGDRVLETAALAKVWGYEGVLPMTKTSVRSWKNISCDQEKEIQQSVLQMSEKMRVNCWSKPESKTKFQNTITFWGFDEMTGVWCWRVVNLLKNRVKFNGVAKFNIYNLFNILSMPLLWERTSGRPSSKPCKFYTISQEMKKSH